VTTNRIPASAPSAREDPRSRLPTRSDAGLTDCIGCDRLRGCVVNFQRRPDATETIVNKVLSTESMGAAPVTAHVLSRVDDLTPHEVQVAQPAARGVSNRRIGETLVIVEKAANHLQNALDKLDAVVHRACRACRGSWASHRHRQSNVRPTSMLAIQHTHAISTITPGSCILHCRQS
jgi:DNA-binding CsgD family transcriptional regulator